MKRIYLYLMSLISMLTLISCDDILAGSDNDNCTITLSVTLPDEAKGLTPENLTISFLNISTGKTTVSQSPAGNRL